MRLRRFEGLTRQPFERRAPHMLRLGANVAPVAFEEIVGDEGDRQFPHRLLAHDLAPEPLLEAGEGLKTIERVGAASWAAS